MTTAAYPLNLIDPMTFDHKRFQWIWDKISKSKVGFDDLTRGNGKMFFDRFVAQSTMAFEYADSGLIMVERIVPKLSADIHFFCWDPDLPEKEIVACGKEVIRRVIQTYALHRISACPPAWNLFAERIAVRVGFRYEGTARQAMIFDGKYVDCKIYGLLAHEFEMNQRKDIL